MSFQDRFAQLTKILNHPSGKPFTRKEIGSLFNVSGPSITYYIAGSRMPSMETAILIAVHFDICVEWLLTGRGPKYPKASWPDSVQELADLWESLPDNARATILTIAQTTASQSSYTTDQIDDHDDPKPLVDKIPH